MVLSHAGEYFSHMRDSQTAEKLLIGSLLIDPMNSSALLALAHHFSGLSSRHSILHDKDSWSSNIATSEKYLRKIDNSSPHYLLARLECVWIQEIKNKVTDKKAESVPDIQANILQVYRSLVADLIGHRRGRARKGDADRLSSCLLHSLAYQYHSKGTPREAIEMYERALTFDCENSQALMLLAMLRGSSAVTNCSQEVKEQLSDQVESNFRRGILSMPVSSSLAIAYLIFGEFLAHSLGDYFRAEQYYLDAISLAVEISSLSTGLWLYATVALLDFYTFVVRNLDKAERLLIKTLKERHSSANITSLHSFSQFYDLKKIVEESQMDVYAALYVATGFFLLHRNQNQDAVTANKFVTASITLRNSYAPGWRCAALIATRSAAALQSNERMDMAITASRKKGPPSSDPWNTAIEFATISLSFAPHNVHSLLTFSILQFKVRNFSVAISALHDLVKVKPHDVLARILLAVLLCNYRQEYEEALLHASAACETIEAASNRSFYLSCQCYRIRGQVLLFHFSRFKDAAICFQRALKIQPSDSFTLSCLAICQHLITHPKFTYSTPQKTSKKYKLADHILPLPFSLSYPHSTGSQKKMRKPLSPSSWEEVVGSSDSDILMKAAVDKTMRARLNAEASTCELSAQTDDIAFALAAQHEISKALPDSILRARHILLSRIRQRVDASQSPSDCQEDAASSVVHPLVLYMAGLCWEISLEDEFEKQEEFLLQFQLNSPEKLYFAAVNSACKDAAAFLLIGSFVERNLEKMKITIRNLHKAALKDKEIGTQKKSSKIIEEHSPNRKSSLQHFSSMKALVKEKSPQYSTSASTPLLGELLKKLARSSSGDDFGKQDKLDDYGSDRDGDENESERNEEMALQKKLVSLTKSMQLHQRLFDQVLLQKCLHGKLLKPFSCDQTSKPLFPFARIYLDENEWMAYLLQTCERCDNWASMLGSSKTDSLFS